MRLSSKSRGAIMVELMVSGLLLAVAVATMASALLQSSGQGNRLQNKEKAALCANQTLQSLKNYITVDASPATQSLAPDGCWNFRNPPITGACPAGWALSPCTSATDYCHNVDFLISQCLPGGTMRYSVILDAGGRPQVSVQVNSP